MHENLFSYIRAEGCCTKCKCVGRESRANLFAHDRAQHLVLERSESTKVRQWRSGSSRERRTHQARNADGYHCEERGRSEGTEVNFAIVIPARACAERSRSKRGFPLKYSKQALHTECFFCIFSMSLFLKIKNYIYSFCHPKRIV